MAFINPFIKKCLGIDIGAFSIKIIEISAFGKKIKLENYVQFSIKNPDLTFFDKQSLSLLNEQAAEILTNLLKRSGIKEKRVALSLPDFSIFSISFSLPPILYEELPHAIEFEAQHYIPLPLSEVTYDWQIIEKKELPPLKEVEFKILLMAVPTKVLWDYQKMINLATLELKGLEAEVFALVRSSIPKNLKEKILCLIDLGWESSTINIIEKKNLKESYSFNISSKNLTEKLSSILKIDFKEAERLKKEYGLDPQNKEVSKILIGEINAFIQEIEKICQTFTKNEKKEINDIILAGGSANLFGLKEYFEIKLKKNIYIADPFSKVSFPSILEPRLKEIGASFGVAMGVALMGLEI